MDYTKEFFSQSYKNALDDYTYSCNNLEFNAWDRVILTAANERQAGAYRLQIDVRPLESKIPGVDFFAVTRQF